MRLLPLILALSLVGCSEVSNVDNPNAPSRPDSPPNEKITPVRIEFRVTGNANGARVKLSNAVDGLSQITTTLPYITSITTSDPSMFVSLEATPTSYPFNVMFPFLSVQIFADGKLFREATSNEFLLNTLVVNGTWRK
jgi:hypothetical protein